MALGITPIGVNDAFTIAGFDTNYLVESDETTFLIDCGTTASRALTALGRAIIDIEHIYISHLHLDHVGGLFELGTKRFFAGMSRPNVYLHPSLIPKIWDKVLAGTMEALIDRDGKSQIVDAATYFNFVPIEQSIDASNDCASIGDVSLRLVPVQHIPGMDCHGVVLNDKSFVTTDTIFQPEKLEQLANRFGLVSIFHDCTFEEFKQMVHAGYHELITLPQDLRELVIATHYEDGAPEAFLKNEQPLELRIGCAGESYSF